MKRTVCLAALVTCTALLSTGTRQSVVGAAAPPLPFSTISIGDRSGVSTPGQVVIRNATEWRRLWAKHAAGTAPPAALPRVDFSQEMVIAVFAGRVPVPSRIAVVKIVDEGDRLMVLVATGGARPGPLGAEPVATTPFHIVRLRRLALPVVFAPARPPDVLPPLD